MIAPVDIASIIAGGDGLKRRPSGFDVFIAPLLDRLVAPDAADLAQYPSDTEAFVEHVLGVNMWSAQRDILRSVRDHRFTAVKSCHSIGKSYIASRLVLAFLHTRPRSVVVTTGPSGNQVRNVMWRNVRAAAAGSKAKLLGRPLVERYEIAEDWYGLGFKASKDNLAAFQGFHAESILVIIDEATGVADDIIDVLRAAMTSQDARMLMLGNPVSTGGRFHEAFHGAANAWNTISIAWPETPNYAAPPDDPPFPGLITHQFVQEAIDFYGEDSAYVRSRIYAEFVSAEDVLIPLNHIEDAARRFDDEDTVLPDTPVEAGLDVARYGSDDSVLAIRRGAWLDADSWDSWNGASTIETAYRAVRTLDERAPGWSAIKIDEGGVGGGVVDQVRSIVRDRGNPPAVRGVNFGARSSDPDRWTNQRNEGYWTLAERFRRGDIAGRLPKRAEAELSDLRYGYDGRHTMPVIESKDAYKERRGRSPDFADALMLAFYTPPRERRAAPGIVSTGVAKDRFAVRR